MQNLNDYEKLMNVKIQREQKLKREIKGNGVQGEGHKYDKADDEENKEVEKEITYEEFKVDIKRSPFFLK